MTILRLILEFMKTGLFAVGGGLATLPFLYEMGEKTGWFTAGDVATMVALGESTPGPIGVNMATYVGFTTSGILGAVLASVALAFPSVVIILLISKVLDKFKSSPVVDGVFKGLRPASIGLIVAAALGVAQLAFFRLTPGAAVTLQSLVAGIHWPSVILGVVLFVGVKKLKVHPILFIAFSAVVGILFGLAGI